MDRGKCIVYKYIFYYIYIYKEKRFRDVMRLEVLEQKKGEKVELVLVNGFTYKGKLRDVLAKECIISDIKKNLDVVVENEKIVAINKFDEDSRF